MNLHFFNIWEIPPLQTEIDDNLSQGPIILVDATFENNSNTTYLACIFLDESGSWNSSISHCCRAMDANHAEILVVKLALDWAATINLLYFNIILDS